MRILENRFGVQIFDRNIFYKFLLISIQGIFDRLPIHFSNWAKDTGIEMIKIRGLLPKYHNLAKAKNGAYTERTLVLIKIAKSNHMKSKIHLNFHAITLMDHSNVNITFPIYIRSD